MRSLTNYLDNIEILAGPIVRRCEVVGDNYEVHIWLLTKSEHNLYGEIYPIAEVDNEVFENSNISTSKHVGYKIGANVWVHMVTMTFPTPPMLRDSIANVYNSKIYKDSHTDAVSIPEQVLTDKMQQFPVTSRSEDLIAYQIYFHGEMTNENKTKSLKDHMQTGSDLFGLGFMFNDFNSLLYSTFSHLTIALQTPKIAQDSSVSYPALKVLHGSCRKFHGNGNDASVKMEAKFAETADNPTERHNALFLTGDQIYADDVDADVLKNVIDIAKELFGSENNFIGRSNKVENLFEAVEGTTPRYRVVKDSAQMTVDHEAGQNHLLTFPEFCAMYCMAWNPRFWPKNLKERFGDESKFTAFRGTAALQKLMANIPTYMIFDDHEITDDFYLNNSWKASVKASEMGRRILYNAMLSYTVFQAWGNTPDKYSVHLKNAVKFINLGASTSPSSVENDYSFGGLISGSITSLLDESEWAFMASTQPPTLFINTRTEREDAVLPKLISSVEYDFLRSLVNNAYPSGSEGESLLLVVPTPVIGIPNVEWGLRYLVGIEIFLRSYFTIAKINKTDIQIENISTRFILEENRKRGTPDEFARMISILGITPEQAEITLQTITFAFADIEHVRLALNIANDAINGEINHRNSNDISNLEIEEIYSKAYSKGDHEVFHAQKNGYAELCEFLTEFKPKFVGIFSGDVHYGTTVQAKYWYRIGTNVGSFPVIQMTASALKNKAGGWFSTHYALNKMQSTQISLAERTNYWFKFGTGYRRIELGFPNAVTQQINMNIAQQYIDSGHVARFWTKYDIVDFRNGDTVIISNNFGETIIEADKVKSTIASNEKEILLDQHFAQWSVGD